MHNRNRRWILFWFLVSILQLVTLDDQNSTFAGDKNQRSIFNPRMDYEQWKPLGRGDPLKNDPTYDYVPPVLDKVHYWVEPAMRKPDTNVQAENKKTEILFLGITSKKPAVSTQQADSRKEKYDPYTKYIDDSKYNPNQRIARPSFIPSLPISFFPSLFNQNKNKYSDRAAFSKVNEQRMPYTMLMPPPLENINSVHPLPHFQDPPVSQASVAFPTTLLPSTPKSVTVSSSPSVSVQPANLIFHLSSLANENEFKSNHPTVASSVLRDEPTTNRNVPDFKVDLVYNTNLAPPETHNRMEFAPHNFSNKPLVAADSNHNINYVTPPPLLKSDKEVMFKGHVSDDNMDISNTYVKIGKPEAEVHSSEIGVSNIGIDTIIHGNEPLISNNMLFSHLMKPSIMPPRDEMIPMTMQTIEDMQTMHPPPVTQSPIFTTATHSITKLPEKEKISTTSVETTISLNAPTKNVEVSTLLGSSTSLVFNSLPTEITSASTVSTTTIPTTSTTTMSPATTITSLTTDPLFKHYNQPAEPLKGPLYLIIEGHSKVKTYGPSKVIHGIRVQETNEISDAVDLKYDKNFEVRHLHGFPKEMVAEEELPRRGRAGDLQTLKHVVQTGLGAIDFSDIQSKVSRNDNNVKETEIQGVYEVVDSKDYTTQTYHKGIVEEARKLNL